MKYDRPCLFFKQSIIKNRNVEMDLMKEGAHNQLPPQSYSFCYNINKTLMGKINHLYQLESN